MMADEIRSHVANENFRKGWDETFGKKEEAVPSPSEMVTIEAVLTSDDYIFFKKPVHG